MEKVLIIGSGAREHAIAKSLEKSKHPKMIYCLATNMNPGIAEICEEILQITKAIRRLSSRRRS